jgi:U3 small nucleolar RNA-associated protein 3
MAANRGLTPHRNKEMKNPRKKHRIQYERALVRRKGAVREAVAGAAGAAYGGEATGIKSKISKSRKL